LNIGTGLAAVQIVQPRGFKHGRPLQERTGRLDSLPILSATAGAFMLAGFVKGVIGLGLPTVAIGLLGLLMSPAQAAAILLVPSLATNIWQFVVGGELLALVRRMWPMLAGICFGTFIGAAWLPNGSSGKATVWLGSALVLYAALGLIKIQFKVALRAEVWLGLLMGTATGAITVATGIFVLPGTPYVQALQFERDRMVQALGLSFTVSTVTLAAALGYAGEIHVTLLGPALVALAAALIGMWLGQLVRGRIRAETFRLCFFIGLLLLGAHLALRGVL
jgi:uncharacterized protein